MKRLWYAYVLVGLLSWPGLVVGETAAERTASAVTRWSVRGSRLGLPQGRRVRQVVSHAVSNAPTTLHETRFEGGGFAVTAADDAEGGVIAFAERGELVESEDNPLWTLLRRHALRAQGRLSVARLAGASAASVSDLRVAPLVQSRWDQGAAGGGKCYNYYTPKGYVCGCVATAMAQILRYHEWPNAPLICETNLCYVGDVATNLTMLGGPYDWAGMPYVPGSGTTESNREAIGRLTYDCGVANHMSYSFSGSGAWGGFQHLPLKSAFGYRSAECISSGSDSGGSVSEQNVRNAILACLDARSPVQLGICKYNPSARDDEKYSNGHSIVADGYGYADGVCYVHLNMGWSGGSDAWYALPDIGTGYGFNVVDCANYNIFPTAAGAVVSGHVMANGTNVAAVAVAFLDSLGRSVTNIVTDANGIFSAIVAEQKSYRVVVALDGQSLTNAVTTGRSVSVSEVDWETGKVLGPVTESCGNRWGNDFDLTPPELVVLHVSADGSDETGTGSEAAPFASIGAALACATQANTTVVVGPGTYTGCVTVVSTVVEIRSTDGPESTVIDANWKGCCFNASGSPSTRLSGFTLQRGYANGGAGVYGGVISNCIIRACLAYYYYGGGVGGGAYGATLTDTYVYGNEAENYGGGAAACSLMRCTVTGNWAAQAGSGVDGDTSCRDSIVWGNVNMTTGADDNWERYTIWGGEVATAFDHSCSWPESVSGEGNVTNDPQFVSADDWDFRLRTISPCIGTASDGGNMGAYQDGGVAGVRVSVEAVGPGTVTPAAAVALPGESVTFVASAHHPFVGYETNGVPVATTPELTLTVPENDLTLTARFANTNFFVDAATGDDANDGWSWATAKRTIGPTVNLAVSGERVTVGPGTYDGFISYATDVEVVSREGATSTVLDAQGGDLCFEDNGRTTLRGFSLVNAVATGLEGGGACGGWLVDCVISNCTATAGGGAAYAELERCVLAFNRSETQGGGAVACLLKNCTIYGNAAGRVRSSASELAGGGVDCQCACTNTIVWGNVNATNGTDNWEAYVEVRGRRTSTTVPVLDHCCTEPWISVGDGMVFADPRLVDPVAGDFRLYEISPCLGAGRGGLNMGAFLGAGVIRVIPLLPENPSAADVVAAAEAVGCADPRATAYMGASASNYDAFRVWAGTVGTTAAVLAKRSCLSYEIRSLVATPYLLSDADEVRFEIPGLEQTADGSGWTATIKLSDGEHVVPLTTAKAAFANTLRVGIDPQALRPATADDILSADAGESGAVRLTIRPPSETVGFFGLSF